MFPIARLDHPVNRVGGVTAVITDTDKKVQERTARRDAAVIRALDFELVGALEGQGTTLCGLALRFDDFDCLMTLKARMGSSQKVCFVGSDSIINCILKATREAHDDLLRWQKDKYAKE